MKQNIQSLLRRLGALAAALLLVTLLPLSALALEGTTGTLQWKLNGGVLVITGSGEIPDYTDSRMAPWHSVADSVTRIVVGDGITRVGELAFYGCQNATTAQLSNTVTEIGGRAFKDCKKLSRIDLPSGLKTIGDAAFDSCESLKTIALPEGLQSIGDYAFNWAGLTSITIPSTVTDMGMVAFAYCQRLVRAKVLSPLVKLPDWTFYGCTALKDLSLPETVEQTGEKSLDECNRLTTIYYDGKADLIPQSPENGFTIQQKPTQEYPQTTVSSKSDLASSETIQVTESDGATITEIVKTDYSFILNGETIKPDDLDDITVTDQDDFQVDTSVSTTISATVKDETGWTQVTEGVSNAVGREDGDTLKAEIHLPDPILPGEDLKDLARKDAEVTISTPDGSSWKFLGTDLKKNDFEDRDYNLEYSVEKMEENTTGIPGSSIYKLDFKDEIEFNARVGVPVMVDDNRQYASLYHKVNGKLELVQTVMVGTDSRAWFALAAVDQETEYYVAINVDGIDKDTAIIPDDLLAEYGGSTLTDSNGIQYEITGRKSSWGMGLGTVTLIMVAVLVGCALVIGVVMYTMNRRKLAQNMTRA